MTPKPLRGRVLRVATAVAAFLSLSSCGGTPVPTGTDPLASGSSVVSVPGPIGPAGCVPGSTATQLDAGLEVQGTTEDGAELWVLFDVQGQPTTGDAMDTWWRVPGDKGLELTLVGPDGQMLSVQRARPGVHDVWEKPGEPWFAQIRFPEPGCWRIVSQRAGHTGEIWVEVA